jgi:hypothetical protein
MAIFSIVFYIANPITKCVDDLDVLDVRDSIPSVDGLQGLHGGWTLVYVLKVPNEHDTQLVPRVNRSFG